jgi:hypothetical protein
VRILFEMNSQDIVSTAIIKRMSLITFFFDTTCSKGKTYFEIRMLTLLEHHMLSISYDALASVTL